MQKANIDKSNNINPQICMAPPAPMKGLVVPEELIASQALAQRDASRLLVFEKNLEKIQHQQFTDLKIFLKPGDILIRNNSKVMPARFEITSETGAKIEILLTKKINPLSWQALAKPAKRIKENRKYFIGQNTKKNIQIQITRIENEDEVQVNFTSKEDFTNAINNFGLMPTPPYMRRKSDLNDKTRYQTVYAKESGSGASSAAPTAGLHFTQELIKELEDYGIEFIDLTLHVGLGTFLPIKVEDYRNHKMHSEYYEITEENYLKILKAKQESRRIIAIGTTAVRTLESIMQTGKLQGETNIFIYPGYDFKIIDGMITNFHLPDSTLILLVAAFLGESNTVKIYQEAIEERYRFFSYGDACLFL